jgi:predicted nucleotidyltransferase
METNKINKIMTKTQKMQKYKVVTTLPDNAMSVNLYAAKQGYKSTSSIYMQLKRGNADFEIVVYNGFNFVIPIQ